MIVLYIVTNAFNIRYTVISNQLVVTAVMEECYRVLRWPEYDSRLCSNNILELVFLRENTLDIFLYKICTFDYLNLIYFSIATLPLSLNPASPFLILPRQ